MRYGLKPPVIGFHGFIELAEQEYEDIRFARESLFEVLFIEEKFDLVLENYYEFESEILKSSARFMIYRDQNYFWLQRERNLISRRIINLLTACRLYLDQIIHHLHNIYGKHSLQVELIRKEKSTLYDTYYSYRVMEALRNYVQHRGIPIHSITFSSRQVENIPDEKVYFSLTPYVFTKSLAEDGEFKKSVLRELEEVGEKVDLKPLIREYIECLGKIHSMARELLRDDITKWEATLSLVVERFKNEFGRDSSTTALAVVKETDEGKVDESKTIFKEFVQRRLEYEKKNCDLESLASRFVTN